jgi:hypothetical protein
MQELLRNVDFYQSNYVSSDRNRPQLSKIKFMSKPLFSTILTVFVKLSKKSLLRYIYMFFSNLFHLQIIAVCPITNTCRKQRSRSASLCSSPPPLCTCTSDYLLILCANDFFFYCEVTVPLVKGQRSCPVYKSIMTPDLTDT